MDKSLQKKLVGAAVLVALAVIFLPMFLDGKKDVGSTPMQIEIPPKPVYDIPNRLENNPPSPVAEAGEPQAMTEMNPLEEQVPSPSANQPPPVVVEPIGSVDEPPVRRGEGVEEITKSAPQVDEAPVEAKPQSSPEPASVAESRPKMNKDAAGFVVQVGSFGDQKNAAELTDRLVASGFPAFLEDIDFRGRTIFRVKVGPQATREDADELRQRLADGEQLEGI
ncbi:MAG: hypothetical protein DSZ28_03565, partial [Thiothrix sp.]